MKVWPRICTFTAKHYIMELTYYGHACFSVLINGKNILFDPFITPNELAKDIDVNAVPADYVFVSHAHFDHINDAVAIAQRTGATAVASFEVQAWLGKQGIEKVQPLNPGGQLSLDFGKVKATIGQHSSSFNDGTYGGVASGFIVQSEAGNFYYSGDTALTLDMQLVPRWAKLDFAVLPVGDVLTMGYEDAAEACKMVGATKAVGVHYDTFGFIKLDKEKAVSYFKEQGIELLLPAIGETVTL